MLDKRNFDIAAVGTRNTYTPGTGLVHTVIIQNPSGMWLYVQQGQQYVPPQALGAIVPIDPPQATIDISYVAAPIGGLASAVTGGPITVTYTDVDIPAYQGLDYGLDNSLNTLNGSITQLDTDVKNLVGGFGSNTSGWTSLSLQDNPGNTGILVPAPGANISIVLMGLSLAWSGAHELRGHITPRIYSGVSTNYALPTLTPENPTYTITFPPLAITLPQNTALNYSLTNKSNPSLSDSIFMTAYYYTK